MNKKVNTVLFILAATVVNIVIMLAILTGGMYLLGAVLPERVQESAGQLLFIVLFLAAVGGAFLIYNRIIRLISTKIDLDRYFHPIFKRRPRS